MGIDLEVGQVDMREIARADLALALSFANVLLRLLGCGVSGFLGREPFNCNPSRSSFRSRVLFSGFITRRYKSREFSRGSANSRRGFYQNAVGLLGVNFLLRHFSYHSIRSAFLAPEESTNLVRLRRSVKRCSQVSSSKHLSALRAVDQPPNRPDVSSVASSIVLPLYESPAE